MLLLEPFFIGALCLGSVIAKRKHEVAGLSTAVLLASPKIVNGNDEVKETAPPLIKKFQQAGEWFKKKFQKQSEAQPVAETAEEIANVKALRAHGWQSLLFLVHIFLIIAGVYFALLRTFMMKYLQKVNEIDAEEILSAAVVRSSPKKPSPTFFAKKIQEGEDPVWTTSHGVKLKKESNEVDSEQLERVTRAKQFDCRYPFDENGVLYYIGRDNQIQEGVLPVYRNPHITGQVQAKMSTVFSGSEATIVAHSTTAEGVVLPNYTNNLANSWVSLDLGEGRSLRPTTYCIRHGASLTGNAIRSWELCAKEAEGDSWDILREHKQDESLSEEPFSESLWDLSWPDDSEAPDTSADLLDSDDVFLTGPAFHSNYANVMGASGIVEDIEIKLSGAQLCTDAAFQSDYTHVIGASGIVEGRESKKVFGAEVHKDAVFQSNYAHVIGASGIVESSESNKKSYRYFTIMQTGVNSSGNDCLFIGGLEFYGTLIERR